MTCIFPHGICASSILEDSRERTLQCVCAQVPVKSTYMALLQVVLKNMKEDFDSYTSQETFEMVRKAVLRYYSNKLKSGARATAGRMLWNTLSNSRTPVEVRCMA